MLGPFDTTHQLGVDPADQIRSGKDEAVVFAGDFNINLNSASDVAPNAREKHKRRSFT